MVQNNKTIITNTHIGYTCDMYTSHLRHIHIPVILSQDRRLSGRERKQCNKPSVLKELN